MATAESNQALIEQLPRLDAARLRAYRENLAFYQGQQWPGGTRKRERRLVFNYAKTLIDKTASYLMGGVSFVVDPEDASEAAQARARQAEKALRDVYEANSLAQLDFDSEVDAAVLGDGVYKVTWDPMSGASASRRRMCRAYTPGGWAMTSRGSGGWRAATASRRKRRPCSTAARQPPAATAAATP
jgi:hypothetical protein